MLALTRKVGESIILNDDIELVVLSVQREQAKIGIKAPKSVPIMRKEIYDQIKEENKQAADTALTSFDHIIPNMKEVK